MTKRTTTICAALLLAACAEEEQFPAIITEMADGVTNERGVLETLLTDDDRSYTLTNPQNGLKAKMAYRGLYSYTTEGQEATMYSFTPAYVLHDSSDVAASDPLGVVSAWSTRHYVNLHLTPKTQGGQQFYGYSVNRLALHGPARLSLHHRQNADPLSYTEDVYASIAWKDIDADSVLLTINTFGGEKQFLLKKKP